MEPVAGDKGMLDGCYAESRGVEVRPMNRNMLFGPGCRRGPDVHVCSPIHLTYAIKFLGLVTFLAKSHRRMLRS